MIKKFEEMMIQRYRDYFKDYMKWNSSPGSCNAGHLQEISWVLHELLGYTDKDIRQIENEVLKELERE